MNFRVWLIRGLWLQLGGLIAAVTSGGLSLLLGLSGDAAGASALRAIAVLASLFFLAAHIGVVVLLTVRELDRDRQRPE